MVQPLGEGVAAPVRSPSHRSAGQAESLAHRGEREEQDHRMTVSLVTRETLLDWRIFYFNQNICFQLKYFDKGLGI